MTKVLFIKNFPQELHRALKAKAGERGQSLTAFVIEALTAWLGVINDNRTK